MSPRKSSTSSGKPIERPRYLGVEVSGIRTPSPRAIEQELRRRLEAIDAYRPHFQIIRWENDRGLVRVTQFDAARARAAWNYEGPGVTGAPLRVRTRRTYGTLRKGKLWLRESARSLAPGGTAASSDPVSHQDRPGAEGRRVADLGHK